MYKTILLVCKINFYANTIYFLRNKKNHTDYLVNMVKPKLGNKMLKRILEEAIKIRSQIRPNRSCERKNKHPRKKHHHNMKSCI